MASTRNCRNLSVGFAFGFFGELILKKWLFALSIGSVAILLFWPCSHHARATFDSGLEITMSITPMLGLHSEWTRQVSVEYNGERISKELMSDTGWWRGSNLYRHTSGAYVIHEGQGWCFSFTLEPLEFDTTPRVSCLKNTISHQASGKMSPYYQDLTYLGRFIEKSHHRDVQRFSFTLADQAPELELPDGP